MKSRAYFQNFTVYHRALRCKTLSQPHFSQGTISTSRSRIVAQVGVCHFMFSLIPFRNINHALHRSLKKLLFKEVPCLTIAGHMFERSWWNVSLKFDYFAAVYCTLMFLLVCMCTSDITVGWYKIPLQRSTTWCHLVMGHTVITCHQLTLW